MTAVRNEENQNSLNVADNDVVPIREREMATLGSCGEHGRVSTSKRVIRQGVLFSTGEGSACREGEMGAPGERTTGGREVKAEARRREGRIDG